MTGVQTCALPILVKTKKFAVIGGDLRQARTAGALADDGFATVVYGISPEHLPEGPKYLESLEEAVKDASCVVLPLPALSAQGTVSMPLSDLKLTPGELFSRLAPGTLCFAGKVTPALLELADQSDVTLLDYFDREELTIRNAIPTAEGAIQIAMEELPITLHDSQCLVVGYGRIGKILADFLDRKSTRLNSSH